ncbi:c-type cytochrome [Neisseria montereyensis]|uniref:Cytochrome c n=1 Tax=Neisseria montereyensis TaxID=2973938 RepID=A0ABT2FET9_9NEIS|nr:cytochrome c [Neisseria montereyensis]MCS4534048.1 cytochrome c [Neisseria montereyensis]
MKKYLWALLCLLPAALPAHAEDNDVKARQQYMKEWRGLTKKMNNMLQQHNILSFPSGEFAELASQLNNTAAEPWPLFQTDSNDGNSEAKADIWQQPQAFQAAIRRFNQAAAALNQAARSGSYDAVQKPMEALNQSCKSCHSRFRE